MWLYFLLSFVMAMGTNLRQVLQNKTHPAVTNLFVGTAIATPFGAPLVVEGFVKGTLPPGSPQWFLVGMGLALFVPALYAFFKYNSASLIRKCFFALVSSSAAEREKAKKEEEIARVSSTFQFYVVISVDLLRRPLKRLWWDPMWNDDLRWGPWGVVVLVRACGKAKGQRKVSRWFIEVCFEPVLRSEVEEAKNIHAPGKGRLPLKKWLKMNINTPIAWLNKREESDEPWPYDEAYFYDHRIQIWVRIHKIWNRLDDDDSDDDDEYDDDDDHDDDGEGDDIIFYDSCDGVAKGGIEEEKVDGKGDTKSAIRADTVTELRIESLRREMREQMEGFRRELQALKKDREIVIIGERERENSADE